MAPRLRRWRPLAYRCLALLMLVIGMVMLTNTGNHDLETSCRHRIAELEHQLQQAVFLLRVKTNIPRTDLTKPEYQPRQIMEQILVQTRTPANLNPQFTGVPNTTNIDSSDPRSLLKLADSHISNTTNTQRTNKHSHLQQLIPDANTRDRARRTRTHSNNRACHDDFKETFEREKRFICTHHPTGGVGNSMFEFASVYGMAAAVDKAVVVEKVNPLIKYFRVKAHVVDDICICKSAKFVYRKKYSTFYRDFLNLSEHINYRPGYYFQSWKYFEHVADDIREQFTFREDLRWTAHRQIKRKIGIHRVKTSGMVRRHGTEWQDPMVTVGVHVRRGDMMKNPHSVDYGYETAPSGYFQRAMEYFRKKYPGVLFLVCSKDMQWCKENIVGNDVIYMDGNTAAVDLAILSQCNHSVISVGTFGWWAAYLASGETIYYKHPARNGSKLRNTFSEDMSDYFYPSWIGLD